METVLSGPAGVLVQPETGGSGAGVLVLAGSSGRVDVERARLLARHGVAAMSLRWFGDDGQPPGICEVPLETFGRALDRLAWANLGPGLDGRVRPCRSSWTLAGSPLAFVPYDDDWQATDQPPAFRGHYDSSLATFADAVAAATIPVERIGGDVIVVAGEDDQVWASADFARAIADRRAAHGRATTVLTRRDAGHRTTLPGESAAAGGVTMARGGTPEGDAALGRLAWQALRDALPMRP